MAADPHRWADLRRLLTETGRRYLPRYILALALLGVVSATTAATAWLMKDVINEVFIAKSQSALVFVAVAVLVIYVARGAASYGQGVILAKIGNAIVAEGQERLVSALLTREVDALSKSTSSELVQKQLLAAESTRQLLQVLVTVVGRDFLTLVGLIFVMVVQDPFISSIVLLALPVAAVLIAGLGGKIGKVTKKHVSIGVSIADQMRQIVQGFRVVKAFGIEDRLGGRLKGVIREQNANADRAAVLMARTQPIVETLAGIAVALVILYGGWRVIGHGATPGAFFSFITALLLAYDPARRLASARLQIAQGLVGLRLFYEILDEPIAQRNAEANDAGSVPLKGEISFEDVSFAYGDGSNVLHDVSILFERGRTTALVGGSGSGKSTILSLILGFWMPQMGTIRFDGREAGTIPLEALRANIAYVGQDAFLFDGSVRENIGYGKPGAREDEIVAAARFAHAHEFIETLPHGYDTPVGELAGRLSGGQKSRIAIARAFLRDAPILLLDEPTAALDAQSEEALRSTLAELAEGRTTILVAHRLASVTRADKIIVLDQGCVVEQGGHAQLVTSGGTYSRLYRLQSGEA
ncbi:MAG TPA: ABC transporter ATP-binding protein [Rhabdaerophilum sp.]|nr:ABC transporter ATP-binding protein [Rhabdaerophilum sp.]